MEKKNNNYIKICIIVVVILGLLLSIGYLVIPNILNNLISDEPAGMEISKELVDKTAGTGNTADTNNIIITNEGVKVNISSKIMEEKKVSEKYIVSDMSLSAQAGKTNISFKLTNNSEENLKNKEYKIRFLNSSNKEIGSISGIIDNLNAGEELYFTIYAENDLSNAYNYSFKF